MTTKSYSTALPDEFINLVANEAKGKASQKDALVLRKPAYLPYWEAALSNLYSDLQGQLVEHNAKLLAKEQECRALGIGGKSEYFKYKSEMDHHRAMLMRFKTSIEKRLSEAKLLSKSLTKSLIQEGITNYRKSIISAIEMLENNQVEEALEFLRSSVRKAEIKDEEVA